MNAWVRTEVTPEGRCDAGQGGDDHLAGEMRLYLGRSWGEILSSENRQLLADRGTRYITFRCETHEATWPSLSRRLLECCGQAFAELAADTEAAECGLRLPGGEVTVDCVLAPDEVAEDDLVRRLGDIGTAGGGADPWVKCPPRVARSAPDSPLAKAAEVGNTAGKQPCSDERERLQSGEGVDNQSAEKTPIRLEELDRAEARADELQAAGIKHVEQVIAGLVGRRAATPKENKSIADRVRKLAVRFGLQLLYEGKPAYFVWRNGVYYAHATDSSRSYMGSSAEFLPLSVIAKGNVLEKDEPAEVPATTATIEGIQERKKARSAD